MGGEAEQREFTRVHLALSATVSIGDRLLREVGARGLSMKGVFLASRVDASPGEACRVTLSLGEGPVRVETEGTVVRRFKDGFAVQFTRILGLESFEHLRRLVLLNAVDPEQAEREMQAHAGIRKRH